jgi:glycosyltransferase involved in cell wall biosynthesis
MSKLKLLFLDFQIPFLLKNDNYPVGGACVRQLALVKGLVSLGHEVGILTWRGSKQYVGKELDFDLVESYSLNVGIRKFRYFYYQFPAQFKAVKYYKPDFIFQKGAGSITGTMALIAKSLKIPFVYMAGNDIDADGRYRQRLSYLDSKVYEYGIKNSTKIIVQNSYQKGAFEKRFKLRNTSIIHNPVYYENDELSEPKPLRDRRYVAWLGVFQPQKNLPALLEIIKKTPKREYRIGGMLQTNSKYDIKAVVKKISSQPNVEMIGFLKRHEVIPFLADAIALLNTSYYEGFSNTFLESWLAGTPVITRSIDPDNIISTKGVGMVAEEYSEIPALLRELNGSMNYQSLARRCRDYVIQNHNAGNIAEKFIACLPQQLEDSKTVGVSRTVVTD